MSSASTTPRLIESSSDSCGIENILKIVAAMSGGKVSLNEIVSSTILSNDFERVFKGELRKTITSALGYSYTMNTTRNVKKILAIGISRQSFEIIFSNKFEVKSQCHVVDTINVYISSMQQLGERVGIMKKIHKLKNGISEMQSIMCPWIVTSQGRCIVLSHDYVEATVFHPIMLCDSKNSSFPIVHVPYLNINARGSIFKTQMGPILEEDQIIVSHRGENVTIEFEFCVFQEGYLSSGQSTC